MDRSTALEEPGADEGIYRRYAQLREAGPGQYDATLGAYLVTRYADVYAILRNHDAFSSDRSIALKKNSIGDGTRTIMLSDDPPRHTRLRNLVNRWFTSKAIAPMMPWVGDVAAGLVAAFPRGGGDFASCVAEPLPIMSIAKLLGVDHNDWPALKRWSSVASGLVVLSAQDHFREMTSFLGYFGRAMQARAQAPLDDLISRMLGQNEVDNYLSVSDLKALCVLLLTSGNETTTNLMCNVVNLLARRPALWRGLREGHLSTSSVVEETLRFESPIQMTSRIAMRDAEVNGWNFAKGADVAVCLGAANRDPTEFEEPDAFIPERDHRRHIGFSHGIHFCLGSSLARMETEVLLTELVRRFRRLRLQAPGRRIDSTVVRGFAHLPVVFEN
jgi:cytochrome P450